jgi:hypothetical protein
MESEIIKTSKTPAKEGWELKLTILEWAAIIIGIVSIFFFIWKREFSLSLPIEEGVWGTFGDFMGGCVGTLIAYINIKLLVKTLKLQITSNKEISENNKYIAQVYNLQQFDEQFKILFSQYRETVSKYENGLESVVEQFITFCDPILTSYDDLDKRTQKAMSIYKGFYVSYQSIAPIHFRLLYRIFQQIDEAQIPDDRKCEIIKIVRCQLSPEEILLLRYNALSSAGQKMQKYINRFNLLKHIRMMDMYEMFYLRNKLTDRERNCIDTEIATWKKSARMLFLKNSNGVNIEDFNYSNKYTLTIITTDKKTKFEVKLEKKRKGRVELNETDVAHALDEFNDDDLKHFLLDFCMELFLYSNFEAYNKHEDLTFIPEVSMQTEAVKTIYTVEVTNNKGYALICSQKQTSVPMSGI